MAEEFGIKINNVKKTASDYVDIYQKISQNNESLYTICRNLRANVYGKIPGDINRIINENENYVENLKKLESVLLEIVQKYNETENRILGLDVAGSEGTEIIDEWIGQLSQDGGNPELLEHLNDIKDYLNVALEQLMWGPFAKETNYLGDFLLIAQQNPYGLTMLIRDAWNDDSGTYFSKTLRQVLFGDFVEDSTLVGTVLSVLVGCVPGLGQVADARDLVADIWNLCDEGPETSEWVALAFTAVAFVPTIGDFLKHGDEYGEFYKFANGISDGLGDSIKGVIKNGDEVVTAIGKHVDEFNSALKNKKAIKAINEMKDKAAKEIRTKADEFLEELPKLKKGAEALENLMKKNIKGLDTTIGEVTNDIISDVSGWEDALQDKISDAIDYFRGEKKEEVGAASIGYGGFSCVV